MSEADFCKFNRCLSTQLTPVGTFYPSCREHILQTSPGKNDNLPSVTATSTAIGSGSIELLLVLQSRPPITALYVISVRRSGILPIGNFSSLNPASFRLHLSIPSIIVRREKILSWFTHCDVNHGSISKQVYRPDWNCSDLFSPVYSNPVKFQTRAGICQ